MKCGCEHLCTLLSLSLLTKNDEVFSLLFRDNNVIHKYDKDSVI